MGKVCFFFVTACVVCAIQPILGNNYYSSLLGYVPSYPALNIGYAPVLQPNLDGSTKEGNKSEKQKEGNSEVAKGSKEEKPKEEAPKEEKPKEEAPKVEAPKEEKPKEEGPKEEKPKEEGSKEEKPKEEGSKEEKPKEEGSKPEASKEETSKEGGEKKEGAGPQFNNKYVFPPVAYSFPPKPVQPVLYAPAPVYRYEPYSSSYVVQQPITSYPIQQVYQYVPISNTQAFPVAPYRTYSNPVAKILYSSSLPYSFPTNTKSIISPGARVFSNPGAWNSQVVYY